MATGVILNPWWEVPTSISKEVAGKAGFVAVKGKDGKVQRWRQPPGPTNALGQMKFVMYNQQNIYLHDTNASSRFNSQVRAAQPWLHPHREYARPRRPSCCGDDGGEWTPRQDRTRRWPTKKTVEANFVKPLPVYIVYFSVAALTDGSIVNYDDLYKRDAKVIAALLDTDGKAPRRRSRPKKVAHAKIQAQREKGGLRLEAALLCSHCRTSLRRPACRRRSSGRRRAGHDLPLVWRG